MIGNKLLTQAALCEMLAARLNDMVRYHEDIRTQEKGVTWHAGLYGYNGMKEEGACADQIKDTIVLLRRELNRISKMIDGVI